MIRHNDPAMLPGFERILDEVKGNSDDGNSNNSVRPLAVQDKAPTGTPSQNIIMEPLDPPPPVGQFCSMDNLVQFCKNWSKHRGYAVAKANSHSGKNMYIQCN
ncbi:hypothetical protein PSTT_04764 [Puccinia striiformis]|uniref:Uncharacterized protein n=1 Tax=Puccinia striiformis TaxID=27350 RepID=A0A2S4VRH3_9BASI|nr:hypothetical protein PSTT_04764 [Puccinia striiformis]